MTLQPLAQDFALMSPPVPAAHPGGQLYRLSLRSPHAIDDDEIILELADERDRRRAAYPRLVEKGRLTADEARRHQAILAAIAGEIAPLPDALPLGAPAWIRARDAQIAAVAASGFGWDDKIRELRREIAIRRAVYPALIAKGRPPGLDEARTRMERIEAAHWRYWITGFGWRPPAGLEGADRRAACRAFLAERDAVLFAAHQRGDLAVTGYVTPEWLAAHEREHLAKEAA